ncbi:MAG: hypothetical protein ACT4OF_05845 [Caulobacteraceae bacterium]
MNAIAEPTTLTPLWERTRAMFARAVAAIGAPAAIAAHALIANTLRRDIVGWLCLIENIVRKLLLAEAAELKKAELARVEHGPRLVQIPLTGMAQHWSPNLARKTRAVSQLERAASGRACDVRMETLRKEARPEAARSMLARPSPSWTAGLSPRRSCTKPGQARIFPCGVKECAPEGARSNLRTPRSIDLTRPETWSARFSFAIPPDPRRVPDSRAPRIRDPWRLYVPPPPPPARSAPRPEERPFRLARRLEALRRVLEDPLPHARRLAALLSRAVRHFTRVVEQFAIACARTCFHDRADPRLTIEAMAKAMGCEDAFPDTS